MSKQGKKMILTRTKPINRQKCRQSVSVLSEMQVRDKSEVTATFFPTGATTDHGSRGDFRNCVLWSRVDAMGGPPVLKEEAIAY